MLIRLLDEGLESRYDDFLARDTTTLFFSSNKYRKFLKEFLREDDAYFVALDAQGVIKGVLPSFIKHNEEYGNILNSLPFYGSNGGVIEFEGCDQVKTALLSAFYSFATQNNCVASTIISSPLDAMETLYEMNTSYTYKDLRIGQMTPLPEQTENIDATLMKLIDSKMRNLIRKAQKLGISVHAEQSNMNLDFLICTHQDNLADIGGLAKPERFFRLLSKYFIYGSDYRIFAAKQDGQLISALLVFYFNRTVEYYTPVLKAEFRSSQPLSLLIFESMKDAIGRGYKWWNWGGTWQSQEGVYHFKKQWGTVDKPYHYYTRVSDQSLLLNSKEQLLNTYPYFFVAPFNQFVSVTNDSRTS